MADCKQDVASFERVLRVLAGERIPNMDAGTHKLLWIILDRLHDCDLVITPWHFDNFFGRGGGRNRYVTDAAPVLVSQLLARAGVEGAARAFPVFLPAVKVGAWSNAVASALEETPRRHALWIDRDGDKVIVSLRATEGTPSWTANERPAAIAPDWAGYCQEEERALSW